MNRRHFSTLLAASAATPCLSQSSLAQAPSPPLSGMGVSAASCGILLRNSRKAGDHRKIAGPLEFLGYCHESFQAAGVQIGVSGWEEKKLAHQIRDRAGELGMYLEGQIRLPKDETDLARFEAQVSQAQEAGISILRTIMLSGRRYETFKTREAWDAFRKSSMHSLQLAERAAQRKQVRLALENHKDWRIEEMLSILESISSEHLGVNLDTGNNIALLEDPHIVVEALAPHAITTHLKDMDYREYPSGFLLAEVPLGRGRLDVPRIMATCRKANPQIRFNLEMITRDPLQIPCLEESYWTTFDAVPAQDLARIMLGVKTDTSTALPTVSQLNLSEQIDSEHENNAHSFDWFRANRP